MIGDYTNPGLAWCCYVRKCKKNSNYAIRWIKVTWKFKDWLTFSLKAPCNLSIASSAVALRHGQALLIAASDRDETVFIFSASHSPPFHYFFYSEGTLAMTVLVLRSYRVHITGADIIQLNWKAVTVTPLKSEFLKNRGRYHKMVLGHHRWIS